MAKIDLQKLDESVDYAASEAYKRLRTNLQLCGADKKVILATSTFPNEGKSTTTVNLAVSLTEIDKKVLFIDADLRKSVLTGRYQIQEAVRGLSHYLAGQETLDQIINETNISGMDMILAGPNLPNPSEMLSREAFQNLINYGREHYDYVIIDAPPVASVIDAVVIAPKCDGTVLVIASAEVNKKTAMQVKQQLEKTGTPVLGAILNKVDMSADKYYGKYYGKY